MKRHSYRERDYAFGQAMLSQRTSMGMTQAGLADLLRVSRYAVGEWEADSSYPKAHHLQHFIVLCVQQHVFPPGREAEEIRAFWKAAHQKVLLNESWLSAMLTQLSPPPVTVPVKEATGAAVLSAPPPSSPQAAQPGDSLLTDRPLGRRDPSASGPRVDWVGALDVSRFTGREVELAELSQWIVQEHCRLVAILGMGGIGKSALVSLLGKQLAPPVRCGAVALGARCPFLRGAGR